MSAIDYMLPADAGRNKGEKKMRRTPSLRCGKVRRTCQIHTKIQLPTMKKEYDFSKSVRNPYAKRLKKQVTLRLDEDVVAYFKQTSAETGISLQKLINLYLRECAAQKKRLKFA